ncbi:MAG: phosphoribosylamine--glycine ligase [Haliangiales bacterium]
MKILVIGSGGREHALCWRLAQSDHDVVCAPGNPGIAAVARCLDVAIGDLDRLVQAAVDEAAELVVVGPEAPLVAGLADRLRGAGIAVFGPGADGAKLEGSKIFCKQFFERHSIPTARFRACATVAEADSAIDALLAGGARGVVVKADGLAGGKGVVVAATADEARAAARAMLEEGRFGAAGAQLIVEERLHGRELSVMALCDGSRFVLLAQAEDHKALHDGDVGPNTGGMGTVSPPGFALTPALIEQIEARVFTPTVRGLKAEDIDYRGLLYAGLMIDDDGQAWMLEYNCRFGDPETQPVLARLESDLGLWLAGAARGALPAGALSWDPRTAVCVVLCAPGYPRQTVTGATITGALDGDGQPRDFGPDVTVFHASTARAGDALVTAGGRVLGVTALANDIHAARQHAYQSIAQIHFEGVHYRRDIGARAAPATDRERS